MSVVIDLIQARVIATLRQAMPTAQPIRGDSAIAQELGIDSRAMLELILALEDRFDISIPLERVARVATVDDLVDTLKSLSARGGARALA